LTVFPALDNPDAMQRRLPKALCSALLLAINTSRAQ